MDNNIRIVSGMRPTGPLHLGHYFGTLVNWIDLQKTNTTFFFIADWHALTSNYAETNNLQEYVYDILIDWLAAGLNPEQSVLFQQSKIPQHAELNLILGMITPLSWLERNPTYKEQQEEIAHKEINTFGFLGYPVLMAADILLYKAQQVPVGQDQLPHIELVREIVRRFNHLYGPGLIEPKELLTATPKCPGIDGRKMSKSYGNSIFLKDPMKTVEQKIQKMFTDPSRLKKTDPGNPNNCNLFPYHKLLSPQTIQMDITEGCTKASLGCVECKKILLKRLEEFLEPLHLRRNSYEKDKDMLNDILLSGNKIAYQEAEATMGAIRKSLHIERS